jgi:hypothetical protein
MNNNLSSLPEPLPMEEVIGGLRYRTRYGVRIAYHWRPGHATRYYSTARRIHLFVTKRGNYFCQEQETEPESSETGPFGWTRIRVLSTAEALRLYLEAEHKLVPMQDAFPRVEIEA